MTVVRFAPSPTGRLHLGNARLALANWLFARAHGGQFILRLDDTDTARSREEFALAIQEDLLWLGLEWDLLVRQSARMDRYRAAFEHLREEGRLYPCYETSEELELRRRLQLARGEPPRYDRSALNLTDADRLRLEEEGRRPHWRLLLADEDVSWTDLVRGRVQFEARHISDPVLFREDGRPLYTLSSVVDDIELGVTHIIRGADHVANTAVQLQLFAALGSDPSVFAFAHVPLLTDAGGGPLSKREGSFSLADVRERGIEAAAVTSLLARLGTPDPVVPSADLRVLAEGFDLSRFGRASPRFDMADLERLNAAILHQLDYSDVAARLGAMGLNDFDEQLWLAIRGNLTRLDDAAYWHMVCRGNLPAPTVLDRDFVEKAAELLPDEPWNEQTWRTWTTRISEATGRRGKSLYHPLRMVLTGRDQGPELKLLLPQIGRAKTLERLRAAAAAAADDAAPPTS